MNIGLIDVDGHHYPNLALMKLASYHKQQGDIVSWYQTDCPMYDIVYMAKVFSDTYSPDMPKPANAKKVVQGGTGYAIWIEDGKEVYHPEKDPPCHITLNINIQIIACIRNTQVMESL